MCIRDSGTTIHTGRTVPDRERNTLSIGWSRWSGPLDEEPSTADARHAWQLDPAVREAMPHDWMKVAWDRWAETKKLGETLEDRYAGWDIEKIKAAARERMRQDDPFDPALSPWSHGDEV